MAFHLKSGSLGGCCTNYIFYDSCPFLRLFFPLGNLGIMLLVLIHYNNNNARALIPKYRIPLRGFFFSIHSNIIIYQFVSLDATHPFLLLSSTSPSVLNSLNLINTSILKITFFFHLFFLKSTLKQTPLPHIFP